MSTPPPESAPDGLKNIRHVIVLMLENRSFDNLLGWLYDGEQPLRGQQFEGLHPGLWNPLDNIDPDGVPFVEKVYALRNGDATLLQKRMKIAVTPDFTLPHPDPGEGYRSTNHQLFGHYEVALEHPPEPTNLGFVNDYRDAMLYNGYVYGEPPSDPRRIMTCYTPQQVPVLSTLAKQFAVCDHWHASVPSQTLPNRHFVHAATSCGEVNNKPRSDCDAPTIYNAIQDAIERGGRSDLAWKVYGTTEDGKLFSLTRLLMTALHDPRLDPHFVPLGQFYDDAASGSLPSYAFLEPRFHLPDNNDQHPPADVRLGEKLIAEVYNAIVNSPQWHETLLVITYDEHGGCYDHVAPPGNAKPPDKSRPPGQDGFLFNRFGVRVPAVVVSPWIEPGTICRPPGRTPFDHTSIIATVRRCFGLNQPLTERDAAAPDLGCCLTLREPRTDKPEVRPLPVEPPSADQPPNELHRVIANVLAMLSGRAPPDEKELSAFVHDAYEEFFANRPSKEAPRD